jgi:hypothetical protein
MIEIPPEVAHVLGIHIFALQTAAKALGRIDREMTEEEILLELFTHGYIAMKDCSDEKLQKLLSHMPNPDTVARKAEEISERDTPPDEMV